ncbi:MAG: hypothetical protein H7Y60_15595 [Rhodospirillaceae bacterium]|nr:hypothetical protein [Rhodospirillales bacterium]
MRGFLGALVFGLCAASAAQASERLQVPELPGWKMVVSVTDRAGETSELIPESETNERWTRRATIQAFRGVPLSAAAFLEQVVQKTAEVCDSATAGPSSLGKVSGAEAGTRTVACGRYKGDGKGSFTLHYVVRGREALYVISRIWRGEPFNPAAMPIANSELAEWTDYVNAIVLCDSRDQSCR